MRYRFTSNGLIHAPGMLASFFTQWSTGDDTERLKVVKYLAAGWPGVPIGLWWDWLEGKVATSDDDEGQTLVVEWEPPRPDHWPNPAL